MMSFGDGVPVRDTGSANGTDTAARPALRRVLIPVADTSQAQDVVEAGGRRFPLETESEAAEVVEATVFELRMAGIASSGQVRPALVGRVAQEIVAEATEWGADLIVLGFPRRGELATRLFGSVTLRVLEHAPCPVLVASPAGQRRLRRVAPVTTAAPGAHGDHPAAGQDDNLSAAPAR